MKLYKMSTNDGCWNGLITDFVIANSQEEAIEKNEFFRNRMNSGCDCWITEMNGGALLGELLHYNDDFLKYTMEFTITEREDN